MNKPDLYKDWDTQDLTSMVAILFISCVLAFIGGCGYGQTAKMQKQLINGTIHEQANVLRQIADDLDHLKN